MIRNLISASEQGALDADSLRSAHAPGQISAETLAATLRRAVKNRGKELAGLGI